MRDKSQGRDCDPVFVPRKFSTFNIGPNSHPRKVMRYFRRAGGAPEVPAKISARHVHPAHKRVSK